MKKIILGAASVLLLINCTTEQSELVSLEFYWEVTNDTAVYNVVDVRSPVWENNKDLHEFRSRMSCYDNDSTATDVSLDSLIIKSL